jgi:hypothetical protein
MADVVTTDSLGTELLRKFIDGKVCAIRVPNYCSGQLAVILRDWYLNHPGIERYDHEVYVDNRPKYLYYGVDRIGFPYNKTYGSASDSEVRNRYYSNALAGTRQVREACAPYMSPMDRLRLELDEIWADGANVANFEGKKMFVGIGRVMQASLSKDSEEQPHCDSLPPDFNLEGQFSANIYLAIPPSGGEVEIWDVPPLSSAEIANADPERNWRAELPPSFLVKPLMGDLLLINTRRPHAVRSFDQGVRVSIQVFIGYRRGEPLRFWN